MEGERAWKKVRKPGVEGSLQAQELKMEKKKKRFCQGTGLV